LPISSWKSTRSFAIQVLGKADVSIIKKGSDCGQWTLSYIKNKPNQSLISTTWNISKVANDYSMSNVNTYLNTVSPPIQHFTAPGEYLVELDIKSTGPVGGQACQAQFFDTIRVDTPSANRSLTVLVNDTVSCNNLPITIYPKISQSNIPPPYYYKWYSGSTLVSTSDSFTVNPILTKSYTVEIKDSLNCTAIKTFYVSGKPVTSAITGSTSCNKSSTQSYYVNFTAGSTFNWFIENGTQTYGGHTNSIGVLWGNQSMGKVAVQENNQYCLGDTVSLNVSLTNTGIEEKNVFNNLSVYPNPTTGLLNVDFETSEKTVDIEVLDISGKSILKTSSKHSGGLFQKTLDLSALHEGIYFVKISAGEKNTTVKVTLK